MKKSVADIVLAIVQYISVVPLGLAMALPFAWVVSTSLKSRSEIYVYPPIWIPSRLNTENFLKVWNEFPFFTWFINSAIIALAEVSSVVLLSTLAGYSFAKHRFPGRNMFFIMILATMTVPFQVYMVPLYSTLVSLKWHNTYQGIILPSLLTGFSVFMMRQFMQSVPNDYLDAARVDGFSEFDIYFRVAIPLIKPAIATVAALHFIGSWNEFLWPLIIINKPRLMTLPLGLQFLLSKYGAEYQGLPLWNLIMSASLITMLPTVLIFIVMQKYVIQGITMTGLKG